MKKDTIKEVLILNSELETAKAFKAFTDRYASGWKIVCDNGAAFVPEGLYHVLSCLASKEVERIENKLREL